MLIGVDWPTFGAALGMFVTTSLIAWKGWRDKKTEVHEGRVEVVGGILADNMALNQNTVEVRELAEAIRAQTAVMTRLTDLLLLLGQRHD